jgi:hypothetical protein
MSKHHNPFQWLAWALFGNDDDPLWGDAAFNPTQTDTLSWRVKWWLRNPAHNFTFYVIGVAHLPTLRTGRYPQDVFSPAGGWNWAVTHVSKWLRLPFVSYIGRCKFYFGWRERGNFGIKLTRNSARKTA